MDSISSVDGMELVKNPSDVPEIATWMNQVERGDVPAGRDSIALMAYLRRVFADEDIFVDLGMLDDFKRFDVLFPFDLFPWEDFALALFMWLACMPEGLPGISVRSLAFLLSAFATGF